MLPCLIVYLSLCFNTRGLVATSLMIVCDTWKNYYEVFLRPLSQWEGTPRFLSRGHRLTSRDSSPLKIHIQICSSYCWNISMQNLFSSSWAEFLYTFINALFLYIFLHNVFNGSWTVFFFLSVWWLDWNSSDVEEKKINKCSAVQAENKGADSMSFSLALAFLSSWNCDLVHVSEAGWVGRPAATPLSLPAPHKHKTPSKESVKRGDRCSSNQRGICENWRGLSGNESTTGAEAKSWPFWQLGRSPWSFGGWGLGSDACRPLGRKRGPQSGPCFLCERGREFRNTYHECCQHTSECGVSSCWHEELI